MSDSILLQVLVDILAILTFILVLALQASMTRFQKGTAGQRRTIKRFSLLKVSYGGVEARFFYTAIESWQEVESYTGGKKEQWVKTGIANNQQSVISYIGQRMLLARDECS